MALIKRNSFRSKFDRFRNGVTEYKDFLTISETKLHSTIPHDLYYLKELSNPYRLDGISHGVKISVYVRDDIPSNFVKLHKKYGKFEGFFIEPAFSKKN